MLGRVESKGQPPVSDPASRKFPVRHRKNLLSVSAPINSEAERDRIAQMLEEFRPIDFDHAGSTAGQAGMPDAGLGAVAAGQRTDVQGQEEQVIPVVKEDLDVGKRATERRWCWRGRSRKPSACATSAS
jgi:hypothetical protein